MTIGKSKDVTNISQLLLTRAVDKGFEVTEDSTSMNKLCGINTSGNTFQEVEKTVFQHNLKWNLLRCVMINGCKNICRAEKRLVFHKFTKLVKM